MIRSNNHKDGGQETIKEAFSGFSHEDVQNCAEKFVKLLEPLADRKPLTLSYEDINENLKQKLFNFYLYKNRQKHYLLNSPSKKTADAYFNETRCKGFHSKIETSRKRSFDEFAGSDEEICAPAKKIKINSAPISGCIEYTSSTNRKHNSICVEIDKASSNSTFAHKSASLSSPSVSTPNGFSPFSNSHKFSTVKLLESPLNTSSKPAEVTFTAGTPSGASNLSFDSFATPRSVCLREPRLKLRNDDKEKLKRTLIKSLKDEMEEEEFELSYDNFLYGCSYGNETELYKRVCSSSIKSINSTASEAAFVDNGVPLLNTAVSTTCSHLSLTSVSNKNGNRDQFSIDRNSSPNFFESLSEKIMNRVRQLVGSSHVFNLKSRSSEKSSPEEMVANNSLVVNPETGVIVITSSPCLDSPICFACGSVGRPPDDKLVYCNACCEPFHKYCLGYKIKEDDHHSWICNKCQKNILNRNSIPGSSQWNEIEKILPFSRYASDSTEEVMEKFKVKRRCILCRKFGDLPSNLGGRLLYLGSEEWVHINCILWSEGVREESEGCLVNVRRAINNALLKSCSHCKRPGAGLRCSASACQRRFHFSCAVSDKCSFFKNVSLYCSRHSLSKLKKKLLKNFRVRRKLFAFEDLGGIEVSHHLHRTAAIGSLKVFGHIGHPGSGSDKVFSGFSIQRKFWSTKDPRKLCTYFCNIFKRKESQCCTTQADNILTNTTNIIANEKIDCFVNGKRKLADSSFHDKLVEFKKQKLKKSSSCSDGIFAWKILQVDGAAAFEDSEDERETANAMGASNGLNVKFAGPRNFVLNSSCTAASCSASAPQFCENCNNTNVNSSLQNIVSGSLGLQSLSKSCSTVKSPLLKPSTLDGSTDKSPASVLQSNLNRPKILTGKISYLGTVTSTGIQSLLNSKVNASSLLSNHKFPNVTPMSMPLLSRPVDSHRCSSVGHGVTTSLKQGSLPLSKTVSLPSSSGHPKSDVPPLVESAFFNSNEKFSNSSISKTVFTSIKNTMPLSPILKPAIGFGKPKPFEKSGLTLMNSNDEVFSSESGEAVESKLPNPVDFRGAKRVFKDFDDIVNNFTTKTKSITYPRLEKLDSLNISKPEPLISSPVLSTPSVHTLSLPPSTLSNGCALKSTSQKLSISSNAYVKHSSSVTCGTVAECSSISTSIQTSKIISASQACNVPSQCISPTNETSMNSEKCHPSSDLLHTNSRTENVKKDASTRLTESSNNDESEKMIVFEIKSTDGFACSAGSVEDVWSKVVTEVQSARSKLCLKPVSFGGISGLTFFGLDQPVLLNLIKSCSTNKPFHLQNEGKLEAPACKKLAEELTEVKEGCARFIPFVQRKPLDHFHFLLSEHRKTIKPGDNFLTDDEYNKNKNPLAGVDLPIVTRYKNMRILCPVSVAVQRSTIHGRGLFAMRNIESGEMVIEYCGEVIRPILTDIREKIYESRGIGCYMFRVSDNKIVDATMKGNAARFINHSCNPNCYSKIVQVDGSKRIVICASRYIRRGEEITYDYKFPIEEGNKIPCRCQSRKCKKFMN